MKQGLWLIFTALALIAAGVLFQYGPEPVAMSAPPSDVGRRPAAVRVSHEFITVPIPTPPAADPGPRQVNDEPRTMLASRSAGPRKSNEQILKAAGRGSVTLRNASRDRNIFEKARRAFLGDGRHRPEPFPRIRDN